MDQGHQGIRLFKEPRSPIGMKCNRIIHKSKVSHVSIIFNNDNVIDVIKSPNIYLLIYLF